MLGIRFDLLAKHRDKPIHTARCDKTVASPDFIEYLIAGKRASRFTKKVCEQLKLLWRKIDLFPSASKSACSHVKLTVTKLVHGWLFLAPPSQESVAASQQLADAE